MGSALNTIPMLAGETFGVNLDASEVHPIDKSKQLHVIVNSHNVVIYKINPYIRRLLDEFTRARLGAYNVYKKWDGSWERKLEKVYAAARNDKSEYRFHINGYPALEEFLLVRGIKQEDIQKTYTPLPVYDEYLFTIADGKEMRDYQLPISKYITEPGKSKLVILQPGKGKTRIFLHALTMMNKRTALIIRAAYIQRWVDDLTKGGVYDLQRGELLVIRGSADLARAMMMQLNGELKAKFIIISNKTFYNYIKTYKTMNGVAGAYPFEPGEFFQRMGIAYRAIDEYHQDFHLNFILDLYTHCEKVIGLSATMNFPSPFTMKMTHLTMPPSERYQGVVYDRYVAATGIYYRLRDDHRLKWIQRGMGSYSHTTFEESLMKHKPSMNRYLEMIYSLVKSRYLEKVQVGQKLLIFCSTVEFCGVVRDYLRGKVFDREINRYTSDDPYDYLLTSDIVVSTLLSAGTAVDIPGLRITLMTTALLSEQANEQAIGRLRKLLMWPDVTPEFIYLVCRDIDAHMRYDTVKKEVFKDKVLSHNESDYAVAI